MLNRLNNGNLFVISGPSGVGKGTLVACVVDRIPECWVSVSTTTRIPRENEVDGVNYNFVDKATFKKLIDDKKFLEWAKYNEEYYGTPIDSVIHKVNDGKQVLLEIECQGAFQVKDKLPFAHLIFVEPPSIEALRNRLILRGTDSADQINKRLKIAELELLKKMEYDYRLVNDDVDRACIELEGYIRRFMQ